MSEQKLIHLAGWTSCGAFAGAKKALIGLQVIFPDQFKIEVNEFETRDTYMQWLESFRDSINASNHKTSPIVYFEKDGKLDYLGGRDDTLKWVREYLTFDSTPKPTGNIQVPDDYTPNHGYDYDLVVIGGGSGGLACAKEARKLGAKVAVLDYVKPSGQGSKWGLGGTCVNVGCIPKKLFHQAALLGEHTKDATSYGWTNLENTKHNWDELRSRVQDHIKSLNFNYRVQLRSEGVTYLNELGRFKSAHELECINDKGEVKVITGARFVIATGGRPTSLDIPGGEHVITSDDLFLLKKSPGKTAVIGAGYIAMECGGFIASLNHGQTSNVTIFSRSIPLRVFDQDTASYVVKYMEKALNIGIKQGMLPSAIEKLPSGKLLVKWTEGGKETSDIFDTVLSAVGRSPDLSLLGLTGTYNVSYPPSSDPSDSIPPITLNQKSNKIVTVNEQTNVPHIYAIGDVIHGIPELTPVAILSGKLLARRLFSDSKETMNYKNIATAVFTPLELGTVGLSEEEAKGIYGEEKIDSYVSSFQPLEWTISDQYEDLNCFAKIVVNRADKNKVLGLHIASPNAGEIIQGFGVVMAKGITYEELQNVVGIHPTVGEEFTVMNVSKSSGQSIEKSGC